MPLRETVEMLAGMEPCRRPGTFVFVTEPDPARGVALLPAAIATFSEDEGLSLLLPSAVARNAGYDVSLPMICITLTVHSALDGVGLTAAVAGALAAEGIPANVVAAYHHDHVLVPVSQGDTAMSALHRLQATARR